MSEVRLIDANALKYKNLAEVNGRLTYVLTAKEINNAPTFDTFTFDDMKKGINVGYKAGRLSEKWERPKGKWIEYKEDNEIRYYCSNCKVTKGQAVNNFCACCGVDMRGEKE